MSTNFYWIPGPSDPLRVHNRVHIGLRAGGWRFMFQAFATNPGPHPVDIGNGCYLMVKVPTDQLLNVRSWKEWRHLLERSGHVEDDCGRKFTYREFVALVEELGPDAKFNGQPLLDHIDQLRKDPRNSDDAEIHDDTRNWHDEAGYSFGLSKFS